MKNSRVVSEWLRFAKVDLETAEHLFTTMEPKPLEIICYHAQQSAEKALKGFLIFKGEDLIKTHDLALLCEKCIEYNSKLEKLYEPCVTLTVYGVQPRYPYQMEILESDAAVALKSAKNIYYEIEKNVLQK